MSNPTYLLAIMMETQKRDEAKRRLAQLEINLRQVNGARPAIQKEEQRAIKRLRACTTQRQRDGVINRLKAFCDQQYDMH